MHALRAEDPRQVGPHVLTGRLGGGDAGDVFLGVGPGGAAVAVKVLHRTTPEDRERLGRDLPAVRRVVSPSLARVLDADPNGEPPYIVGE